jgi:hypothetical protein
MDRSLFLEQTADKLDKYQTHRKWKKYSRTWNFNHSVLVVLFTIIAGFLFSSWCITGASFTISSSSETTPTVKIISPHKGQQVPVNSNIIVSGISSSAPAADKTYTDCAVLVLLDDIKPYQQQDMEKQTIILLGNILLLLNMQL